MAFVIYGSVSAEHEFLRNLIAFLMTDDGAGSVRIDRLSDRIMLKNR